MENDGRLDYRALTVLDAMFRFRVRPLETDFMFADGSVQTFPNWEVKGVRERHYMEEYVAVPVEEYLRSAVGERELVEYGIKASDVRRFVEGKAEFFEDLLLAAAADVPLDEGDAL
jgi:hypothetical protein